MWRRRSAQENILVFEKVDEQFESNIEISLKIEDLKTNAQLDRLIWTERILSEFYNYTRDQANYHSLIKDINIAPGEYRFVITITDSKNSLKWNLDKKIKSGEIKESELIEEAGELMNKLNTMPGMKEMQKMVSSMGFPMGKNSKINMGAFFGKIIF